MLEYFIDWQTKTVTFQSRVETKNSYGETITTWADLLTTTVNWWTDSSRETNVNDKFVDKKTGRALLDNNLGLTPDNTMRIYVSDDETYQIIGTDNVASFGEFYVIDWIQDL